MVDVVTVWFATQKAIESGIDLEKARDLFGTREGLEYAESFGLPCGAFNCRHINKRVKFKPVLQDFYQNNYEFFFFDEHKEPSYNAQNLEAYELH